MRRVEQLRWKAENDEKIRQAQLALQEQHAARNGQQAEECVICQETFSEEEGQEAMRGCDGCNYVVHKDCLARWHQAADAGELRGGVVYDPETGAENAKCFTCTKKLFTVPQAMEYATSSASAETRCGHVPEGQAQEQPQQPDAMAD